MTLLQKQVLFILFTALWMKGKPAVLNCFFFGRLPLEVMKQKRLKKISQLIKYYQGKLNEMYDE